MRHDSASPCPGQVLLLGFVVVAITPRKVLDVVGHQSKSSDYQPRSPHGQRDERDPGAGASVMNAAPEDIEPRARRMPHYAGHATKSSSFESSASCASASRLTGGNPYRSACAL